MTNTCLSHHLAIPEGSAYATLRQKLLEQDNSEALALLEAMNAFPLGRFLIEHRGLNGFWTSYIITRGKGPLFTQEGEASVRTDFEEWFLTRCPGPCATQERFTHFQDVIREHLRSGMHLASIPCGLMDDLLSLDYGAFSGIHLTGVDIDDASLDRARQHAALRGLESCARFLRQDAWNLGDAGPFDLITSNGLNIYEPDAQRETALYRSFNEALKPQGWLVTSFLTPPPTQSQSSPWQNWDPADLRLQKILFADILAVKWQVFHTEDEFRAILGQAGFDVREVRYDRQRMFPTVVAHKI